VLRTMLVMVSAKVGSIAAVAMAAKKVFITTSYKSHSRKQKWVSIEIVGCRRDVRRNTMTSGICAESA
jgi:hypothetical protein